MTKIDYVVGPPGTGKTTWIGHKIQGFAEQYGRDKCTVISLTRAAAKAASAKTDLDKRHVGTLHSHCYHALGQPKMVDPEAIKAWNDEYPDWKLGGAEREEPGDQPAAETNGDLLLSQFETCRHKMLPVPEHLKGFADAWTDHKAQANLVDFTDMIEQAYHDLSKPPGDPRVLMADEFQDLSALELALLRQWSQHVLHFALVGDPNQSIYHWRHAAREAADVVPTEVLGQSYRVPRAVQEAAVALARRSSTYLDAQYKPRNESGDCRSSGLTWSQAESLIEKMLSLEGSVMFLASCAYMISPMITVMRRRGIPYHNPFRADVGWSPLARGSERRRTAVDRLESWLACCSAMTDGKELPAPYQIALLAKTMLRTGAKAMSQEDVDWMADGSTREQMVGALRHVFTPEACQAMITGDMDWLLEHSHAAQRRSMEYPVSVYRRFGLAGLREKPKVIIGTIHSVKGGEADHVILAPDLSTRGMATFRRHGWENRDGILRTFYVGMTRARNTLTILKPQGWAVEIPTGSNGNQIA